MSENESRESEPERRRRRLRFRAWHRGTREMDLVLGRFVDAELGQLSEGEVAELETLMEAADPDLFAWVIGQADVPAHLNTPIFRRLAEFNRTGKGSQHQ
jgi:antitoxin CptB